MNKLEEFKGSNAWDNTYALPLIPMHNNPWIYSAYVRKICGGFDHDTSVDVLEHRDNCEQSIGLFHRWPSVDDGKTIIGGVTSHDEIMGLAYHSEVAAKDILKYLEMHDGSYYNLATDKATYTPERYNVYRFIFLKPYLKARAGWRVGLLSQFQFALFLLIDLITHKKKSLDPGGRLRIWIMLEAMSKYPISGLMIMIWKWVMKNKGISPKYCFLFYLAEVPIMHKLAPDKF